MTRSPKVLNNPDNNPEIGRNLSRPRKLIQNVFFFQTRAQLIHPLIKKLFVKCIVKVVENCGTHFCSVAVVKCVFDHQSFEHLDGDLADLSVLLKSPPDLPQQQAHQEVVSTEVVSQRVVQLEICTKH